MGHKASNSDRFVIESHTAVKDHLQKAKTRDLHNGLAKCVDNFMGGFPGIDSDPARVNILASMILEADDQVPALARLLGMERKPLCTIFGWYALGHHQNHECKEA